MIEKLFAIYKDGCYFFMMGSDKENIVDYLMKDPNNWECHIEDEIGFTEITLKEYVELLEGKDHIESDCSLKRELASDIEISCLIRDIDTVKRPIKRKDRRGYFIPETSKDVYAIDVPTSYQTYFIVANSLEEAMEMVSKDLYDWEAKELKVEGHTHLDKELPKGVITRWDYQ